jgi:CheY-like chemotaxis protein
MEAKVERRRRKRAKMSAQLRVRVLNSPTPFEETCKTVDVSRDGILFVSSHSGYWKGQPLEVTFPYSTEPSALNHSQLADVVRVVDYGGGLFGIGIEFAAAKTQRATTPLAAKASATSPAPANHALVLALEPDAVAGEALRKALENDGYSVLTVRTAHAALDVLKTSVPAIFVTDLENSDVDGHDFCVIIRRNERLQHVPVILLTRSAPADFAVDAQLGAVVCVAKSEQERLLQLIRLLAPPPAKSSAYGAPVRASAIDRNL